MCRPLGVFPAVYKAGRLHPEQKCAVEHELRMRLTRLSAGSPAPRAGQRSWSGPPPAVRRPACACCGHAAHTWLPLAFLPPPSLPHSGLVVVAGDALLVLDGDGADATNACLQLILYQKVCGGRTNVGVARTWGSHERLPATRTNACLQLILCQKVGWLLAHCGMASHFTSTAQHTRGMPAPLHPLPPTPARRGVVAMGA
jgi:hypothetical protein